LTEVKRSNTTSTALAHILTQAMIEKNGAGEKPVSTVANVRSLRVSCPLGAREMAITRPQQKLASDNPKERQLQKRAQNQTAMWYGRGLK